MNNEVNVYMVVRYSDDLPPEDYGVSDHYTLIGAFTDPNTANKVKEEAEKKIAELAASEDIPYHIKQHVDIKEIVLNHNYLFDGEGKEPYLGGASYTE